MGGQKPSKIWCDFAQLHILITNISRTDEDIEKRKSSWSTMKKQIPNSFLFRKSYIHSKIATDYPQNPWGFITVPIPIPHPYPWESPYPRQPWISENLDAICRFNFVNGIACVCVLVFLCLLCVLMLYRYILCWHILFDWWTCQRGIWSTELCWWWLQLCNVGPPAVCWGHGTCMSA